MRAVTIRHNIITVAATTITVAAITIAALIQDIITGLILVTGINKAKKKGGFYRPFFRVILDQPNPWIAGPSVPSLKLR